MNLTTWLKIKLNDAMQPFWYVIRRLTHRWRDDVRCAKCRDLIPRKSRRVWSKWYGGYVEYLCIPTHIRNLGNKQVKIYLRHGAEALYPSSYERVVAKQRKLLAPYLSKKEEEPK